MAQKTRVQLYAQNAATYITNAIKAITAAIVRPFNIDMIDSFVNNTDDIYMFRQIEASKSVAITTGAPVVIKFTYKITSANYSLYVNCYDTSGNNVDFAITNRTEDGFSCNVPINCYLDYIAVNINSGIVIPIPVP